MNLAPVGLVVYNRIEHTKRVIEALKKNTLAIDTDLYIFSDAPSKEEDKKSVSELRKYLKTVKDGFKNVYIYEAEKNLGIKYSTVKAVNTIFENHEYFIGLEDDIETNKYFLEFMNNALNYYKDDEDVMAITAFSHKHATKNHKYDVIFTYAFHSWGWGTWKSKWNNINWDTCDTSWYNKSIKHKILGGVYSWFHLLAIKKSVKDDLYIQNNLWDIYYSFIMYKRKKLCVWPSKKSFTNNIGFDGTGYHKFNFHHGYFEKNLDNDNMSIEFSSDKKMNFFKYLIISIKIGIFSWSNGFITMFFSKFLKNKK